MTKNRNETNPDDRSDNVDKLQSIVQNTVGNIEKFKDTMNKTTGIEKEEIKEKNRRREQSIDNMRQEIEDEYNDNQLT